MLHYRHRLASESAAVKLDVARKPHRKCKDQTPMHSSCVTSCLDQASILQTSLGHAGNPSLPHNVYCGAALDNGTLRQAGVLAQVSSILLRQVGTSPCDLVPEVSTTSRWYQLYWMTKNEITQNAHYLFQVQTLRRSVTDTSLFAIAANGLRLCIPLFALA